MNDVIQGQRLQALILPAVVLEESVAYTCWTDSTIALAWIQGDPNGWKQFVANRVREIQELTDPAHWKHCPGKDNPADWTTRGILAEVLVESDLWLKGLPWISSPLNVRSEDLEESQVVEVASRVEQVTLACTSTGVEAVYEFKPCSSFTRTLCIVSWTRRFVHNVRNKCEQWSVLPCLMMSCHRPK